MAESNLKPLAVSPVGAKGLCQFMDPTWREVSTNLNFPKQSTAFDWKLSIQAAAYYDMRLHRIWRSPRSQADRWNLTLASYNAGAGNLIKAQKRCGLASGYEDIVACLHLVTGHHSLETIGYVKRINRFYRELLF